MTAKPPPDLWQAYEIAVSLRDYVERLIAEHDRLNVHRDSTLRERIHSLHELFRAEQAAAAKAIEKAEVANQRHFESINGLNDRLERQAALMPTRDYVDTQLATLTRNIKEESARTDARLTTLEHWRSSAEGKVWGISFAVGLLFTLVNIALRFV